MVQPPAQQHWVQPVQQHQWGSTDHVTADDAAAADADNDTAAANSTRGAAWHSARTTENEHDDASTTVWHAESVWGKSSDGEGRILRGIVNEIICVCLILDH